MTTVACFYHSEKEAVGKCHRCERPICSDDQTKKILGPGIKATQKRDFTIYEVYYCPVCDMNDEYLKLQPIPMLIRAILICIPIIAGLGFFGFAYNNIIQQYTPNATTKQIDPNMLVIAIMIVIFLIGLVIGIYLPIYLIKRDRRIMRENPEKIHELIKRRKAFIESITADEAKKSLIKPRTDETQ